MLLGFGCATREDSAQSTSETPSVARIQVRAPAEQTLLPNYDGRSRQFAEGRAATLAKASATHLKSLHDKLEKTLVPVIGDDPMSFD